MDAFVDLDGVLVDFIQGVCDKHKRSNPYVDSTVHGYRIEKIWNMPLSEFWAPLDENFWETLPWMPDGQKILSLIEKSFENVYLLTSASGDPRAAFGKYAWVDRHLTHYRDRLLIGHCKHICAGKDRVLFDDVEDNTIQFCNSGGIGVLVPRPWNKLYYLEGVQCLFDQ